VFFFFFFFLLFLPVARYIQFTDLYPLPTNNNSSFMLFDLLRRPKFNSFGVEHKKDASGKDFFLYCCSVTDIEDLVTAVGHTLYYVGPIRYARKLSSDG
jgi:hypothetical protein